MTAPQHCQFPKWFLPVLPSCRSVTPVAPRRHRADWSLCMCASFLCNGATVDFQFSLCVLPFQITATSSHWARNHCHAAVALLFSGADNIRLSHPEADAWRLYCCTSPVWFRLQQNPTHLFGHIREQKREKKKKKPRQCVARWHVSTNSGRRRQQHVNSHAFMVSAVGIPGCSYASGVFRALIGDN